MYSEMVRDSINASARSSSCSSLFCAGTSMGKVLATRLTSSLVPFAEAKDAVKFVCKDFWVYNFRQQASRLQANRKGVFMIHDSNFPLLQSLSRACVMYHPSPMVESSGETSRTRSVDDGSPQNAEVTLDEHRMEPQITQKALELLQFPAGVIQGFLDACGFSSTVEASVPGSIPACAFGITITSLDSTVLRTLRLEQPAIVNEAATI